MPGDKVAKLVARNADEWLGGIKKAGSKLMSNSPINPINPNFWRTHGARMAAGATMGAVAGGGYEAYQGGNVVGGAVRGAVLGGLGGAGWSIWSKAGGYDDLSGAYAEGVLKTRAKLNPAKHTIQAFSPGKTGRELPLRTRPLTMEGSRFRVGNGQRIADVKTARDRLREQGQDLAFQIRKVNQ